MNKVIYMSFLAISAIVLGGFFGGLVDGAAGLSFLGYSKEFAFEPFARYDETHGIVRFCTSWATPPEHVDSLLNKLKEL